MFQFFKVGEVTILSGDGRTFAVKIEEVTKIIETAKGQSKKVVKPGIIQTKKILDKRLNLGKYTNRKIHIL